MLGDIPTNYKTASMSQSEKIPLKGSVASSFDTEAMKRLRESQFKLGEYKNDFNTNYNIEYKYKGLLNNRMKGKGEDLKLIERKLRGTNYSLGEDKPNYVTENLAKYKSPPPTSFPIKSLNMNLQKNHLELGDGQGGWDTTNKAVFTPKKTTGFVKAENTRYRTNFPANVKEDRNFISEARQSYNPKPLISTKMSSLNLRKSNFSLGSDDEKLKKETENQAKFVDPRKNIDLYKNLRFNIGRKREEFKIGDGGNRDFLSVYRKEMTPKKRDINAPVENKNFKSQFSLSGPEGQAKYESVYDSDFTGKPGPYIIGGIDKEKYKIMDFVKNSHFNIGDLGYKNNNITTMGESYKYDKEKARKALGVKLPSNLRQHQYSLGDNLYLEKETTNMHDYKPYKNISITNNINVNKSYSNVYIGGGKPFKGETIYHSDYTQKPLPGDDYFDCFFNQKYQ